MTIEALKIDTTTPFADIILPLPPGINASYKIVKIGRAHRLSATSELQAFKLQAHFALNKQQDHIAWPVLQLLQTSKKKIPLRLELTFYYETQWLHDIDGGIKSVQDAIFKHLSINDNRVIDLYVRKRVDKDNPRCETKLFVADGTEAGL